MTIQDVISQVNQSSGSIFTREDVISILQSIELEEQDALVVPKKGKKTKKGKGTVIAITGSQMEELAGEIAEHIGSKIKGIDPESAFDEFTAEFDLNGSEISLVSVDLNTQVIFDETTDGITDVIEVFMKRLAKRG
jgi:hypothetical protein